MNGAAVPFLALFLFVVQGGILALCLTELARFRGKKAVGVAVVASTVLAAVAGYFWTFALSTSPAFTVLASVLVTGGIAYQWAKKMGKDIAEQLRMAQTVAKFGLDNFEKIDRRGEGQFGSAHLEAAIESPGFNEGGYWLLRHMQQRISDIGHPAGVIASVAPVPHGGGYVHTIYSISRRDLETYESRISNKYRAWL